ncbi:MAG: aldo/keto reductase [Desulfuromonadales bacterium]|nr:aldo/keto reductase [Desulfuromonadales bacterium]MBN2791025.1 aldo/keto reductase [Desulfuromonadales bacterium]
MNDLKSPPGCVLGTMTFGNQVDKSTADQMVGKFLDAGFHQIDTAYAYGDGATENILGQILTKERWQQIYLATKANPWGEASLRPEDVRRQLETSLRRLQTDSVDLFYLHAPDTQTPIEITLEECHRLFVEGKFRELGLSNYPAWQVIGIWHTCKHHGWILPTVYQGMYNAITRDVESELFPSIRTKGIRFYSYNPLAGGILTGKYSEPTQLPTEGRFIIRKNYQERYWKKSSFAAVNLLRTLCEKHQISLADSALRWELYHSLLSGEQNDAIIIGASNIEQLANNLDSMKHSPLPEEIVRAYNQAWDITGSECPAYFRD